MPAPSPKSLTTSVGAAAHRSISDHTTQVSLMDLRNGSCLIATTPPQLRNRSVLLITGTQLPSVLAMIALDGIARRILLATPDLHPYLPAIVREAQVDIVVADTRLTGLAVPVILCQNGIVSHTADLRRDVPTEWVLFTSGTTGQPKMVVHTLTSLAGPLNDGVVVPNQAVWSTFYDVRRYGGLQILLRAWLGGGSLVLSDANEGVSAFLSRLAAMGVTHISGTPSHWRRALMCPEAGLITPRYVRLSGEIADQAILDRLRRTYPTADLAHAFASTEAGVAFDVRDGLAGFPSSFLTQPPNPNVAMKVQDDTLHIRSTRTASGYIGAPLTGNDGFIDTGDIVERVGDRYYFRGRREGVINVGGLKVYPQEVEDVIVQHPAVQVVRVHARPSPITGQLVVADVVIRPDTATSFATVQADLMAACRQQLTRHKVPATWRQVDSIAMSAAGKIQRHA